MRWRILGLLAISYLERDQSLISRGSGSADSMFKVRSAEGGFVAERIPEGQASATNRDAGLVLLTLG